jgi:hypothetical protein
MWTNEYNPKISTWYITKCNGERNPMYWNNPRKFWSDFSGKTYKPEEVIWLDDFKIQ